MRPDHIQGNIMNDKPYIHAGDLTGRELAAWLVSRANAILAHERATELYSNHLAQIDAWKAAVERTKRFARLGISQTEGDPIPPQSMELVQAEVNHSLELLDQLGPLPLGYERFLDLPVAPKESEA